MDEVLESMFEFVQEMDFEKLPSDVRSRATEILVDTLGCAVGGRDCKAARIAESLGGAPGGENTGAVVGASKPYPADLAAFWNTSMIRYLDFNDHLVAGHPSDMLGALFAVSGLRATSGRDLLASIVVAYEVHARFVTPLREIHTVDRGYSIAVGATAGVSYLLGLDEQQTRHALSMAVTSGLLLRAARAGALSDYKGVASAISTQFAVFAAQLAQGGLTGPSAPVDGRNGLAELISGEGGKLELESFSEWKTLLTCQKFWPVAYNMQPSVWAGVELGRKFKPEQVETATLHVAPFAWFESGSEKDKWDPRTRETADHSLPYAFARAFEHGTIDQKAFEVEAFRNQATLNFMSRIEVQADPGLGPQVSDVVGVRARIELTDGSAHEVVIDSPRGHHENPMSREEITAKAYMLMEPVLGSKAADSLEAAWDTASAESFSDVLAKLV